MLATLFLVLLTIPLSHQKSALFQAIPKEVARHVFHSIIPSVDMSGTNLAFPKTVVSSSKHQGVIFFSFNSSELFQKDAAKSSLFEVILRNTETVAAETTPSLWFVSTGSRKGGKGSMWKSCQLKPVIVKRKQNKKQAKKLRWSYFQTSDASCVTDLVQQYSNHHHHHHQIFAAVSASFPPVSARQARTLILTESITAQNQRRYLRSLHRPTLMLASYRHSNLPQPALEPSFPASFSTLTPAPTVSNDEAIQFLLGQSESQRIGRSIGSSLHRNGGIKNNNKFNKEELAAAAPDLCKRQPLLTNVEDVGLQDYILFPRQFDIGTCEGACVFPLSQDFDPRTHTVVQLLHHLAEPQRVPGPQCVPVSFKPIRVLVRKPNNDLAVEVFNDLIVQSCGCR